MPLLPLWKLECYINEDGVAPILISISRLPLGCQEEAEALKRLLEEFGDEIEANHLVSHPQGVFEVAGETVRLFCKFSNNRRVILLDALATSRDNASLDPIYRKARSV